MISPVNDPGRSGSRENKPPINRGCVNSISRTSTGPESDPNSVQDSLNESSSTPGLEPSSSASASSSSSSLQQHSPDTINSHSSLPSSGEPQSISKSSSVQNTSIHDSKAEKSIVHGDRGVIDGHSVNPALNEPSSALAATATSQQGSSPSSNPQSGETGGKEQVNDQVVSSRTAESSGGMEGEEEVEKVNKALTTSLADPTSNPHAIVRQAMVNLYKLASRIQEDNDLALDVARVADRLHSLIPGSSLAREEMSLPNRFHPSVRQAVLIGVNDNPMMNLEYLFNPFFDAKMLSQMLSAGGILFKSPFLLHNPTKSDIRVHITKAMSDIVATAEQTMHPEAPYKLKFSLFDFFAASDWSHHVLSEIRAPSAQKPSQAAPVHAPKKELLVFWAGHAVVRSGELWLLPHNAEEGNRSTAFTMEDVRNEIITPAAKAGIDTVLLILDVCYAGAMSDLSKSLQQLDISVLLLPSVQASQQATDGHFGQHTPFALELYKAVQVVSKNFAEHASYSQHGNVCREIHAQVESFGNHFGVNLTQPGMQLLSVKRLRELNYDDMKNKARGTFVGREQVTDLVREWCQTGEVPTGYNTWRDESGGELKPFGIKHYNPPPPGRAPLLIVTGAGGQGKTAWFASLYREMDEMNDFVMAVHFCRFDDPLFCDPNRWLESFAAQVNQWSFATGFLFPHSVVNRISKGLNDQTGKLNVPSAFSELIAALPREKPYEEDRGILMMVDALDEALEAGGGHIISALSEAAARAPDWLRILTTTRPSTDVGALLPSWAPVLSLVPDKTSAAQDIAEYVTTTLERRSLQPVARKRLEDLAAEVASKADGSFLYAEMYLDSPFSVDSNNLPANLGHMYETRLKQIMSTWEDDQRRMNAGLVLALLVVAKAPLPTSMLNKAAKIMGCHDNVAALVKTMGAVLTLESVMNGGVETVRLFHRTFGRYLQEERGFEHLGHDSPLELLRSAHSALARACLDTWRLPRVVTGRDMLQTGAWNYAVEFGVRHALSVGGIYATSEVEAAVQHLAANKAWIVKRYELDGTPLPLVEDWEALARLKSESDGGRWHHAHFFQVLAAGVRGHTRSGDGADDVTNLLTALAEHVPGLGGPLGAQLTDSLSEDRSFIRTRGLPVVEHVVGRLKMAESAEYDTLDVTDMALLPTNRDGLEDDDSREVLVAAALGAQRLKWVEEDQDWVHESHGAVSVWDFRRGDLISVSKGGKPYRQPERPAQFPTAAIKALLVVEDVLLTCGQKDGSVWVWDLKSMVLLEVLDRPPYSRDSDVLEVAEEIFRSELTRKFLAAAVADGVLSESVAGRLAHDGLSHHIADEHTVGAFLELQVRAGVLESSSAVSQLLKAMNKQGVIGAELSEKAKKKAINKSVVALAEIAPRSDLGEDLRFVSASQDGALRVWSRVRTSKRSDGEVDWNGDYQWRHAGQELHIRWESDASDPVQKAEEDKRNKTLMLGDRHYALSVASLGKRSSLVVSGHQHLWNIRVWDCDSMTEVARYIAGGWPASCVAVLPESGRILSGSRGQRVSVSSGCLTDLIDENRAGKGQTAVVEWKTPYGCSGHEADVVALVPLAPVEVDGQVKERFASGDRGHLVIVWQRSSGPEAQLDPRRFDRVLELRGHREAIHSLVDLSGSLGTMGGAVLASGDNLGEIVLWHPEGPVAAPNAQTVVEASTHHSTIITAIVELPESELVATGSMDRTVRLWRNREPDEEWVELRGHFLGVEALAVIPSGPRTRERLLVATGDIGKRLYVWEPRDHGDWRRWVCTLVLRGHDSLIRGVAALDDHTVVSGAMDGSVRVWDLNVEDPSHLERANAVIALRNARENRRDPLVTLSSLDGAEQFRSVPEGDVWAVPESELPELLTTSADGEDPARPREREEASGEKRLRRWYLKDFAVTVLSGHEAGIRVVKTCSRNLFVTGDVSGALKVWRKSGSGDWSGSSLGRHSSAVTTLCVVPVEFEPERYSRRGTSLVLSGSLDGSVKVWAVSSRAEAQEKFPELQSPFVREELLDGERLYASSSDGGLTDSEQTGGKGAPGVEDLPRREILGLEVLLCTDREVVVGLWSFPDRKGTVMPVVLLTLDLDRVKAEEGDSVVQGEEESAAWHGLRLRSGTHAPMRMFGSSEAVVAVGHAESRVMIYASEGTIGEKWSAWRWTRNVYN